jgi:hypothetical protein
MPSNENEKTGPTETGMAARLRFAFRYLLFLGLATFVFLGIIEIGLRVFAGRPIGYFHYQPMDQRTLYLPNRSLRMLFGPIPYTVDTNSLGLRGPEISMVKPEGAMRIVALGDSVTDGFYVDNADTFPVLMEKYLRDAGKNVEVVNAARGGASIDVEYNILRRYGMPLQPDVVVLTFVTNDIDDLRGVDKAALVGDEDMKNVMLQGAAASEVFFLARTALGEWILDTSLRMSHGNYRRFQRGMTAEELQARYDIPGGANFSKNLRHFEKKHIDPNDSIVGYPALNAGHRETIADYGFVLGHMNDFLEGADIRLILAYCPSYNQVHDPKSSTELAEAIRGECERRAIPFVDLTPAFREGVKTEVLHLAPVDYHLTPAGNRVLGRGIADFLLEQELEFLEMPGEKDTPS